MNRTRTIPRLANAALLGSVCLVALALNSGTDVQPPTGIEFRDVFIDAHGAVTQSTLDPTTDLDFRQDFIGPDGHVTMTELPEASGLLLRERFIDENGGVAQETLQEPPGIVFTTLQIDPSGVVLTPMVDPPSGLEYRSIFIRPDGTAGSGSTAAPPTTPARLLELDGAWPNPFNPNVEIRFRLHSPAEVKVRVFDARGTLVRTLLAAELRADLHVIRWDGRDVAGNSVASGAYVIQVQAGGETQSTKAVLVK